MPRLKFAICHLPFAIYFPFHNFKIDQSLNKRACFLAKLENKWKVEIGKWKIRPAFTLIEILVVITIIGILTSIGTVAYNNTLDKGRDSRRKQDLASIKSALTLYFEDNGKYPPECTSPPCDESYPSDINLPNWIPGLDPYIQKPPKDPRQAGIFGALANLFGQKSQEPTQPQVAGAVTTSDLPSSAQKNDPVTSLTWEYNHW